MATGPSGAQPEQARQPHRQRSRWFGAALALVAMSVVAVPVSAQSLRGSRASLDLQNRQAEFHDYTYLTGRSDLRRFVEAGLLVPLDGGGDYRLSNVSFKVARPEVRLFVERLSAQHVRACGEPLVVTSLTRPKSSQPSNASDRSVHPTGMALDLRIPRRAACRRWLESTLLSLERSQVLEVTRERRPPHYHVALFPASYVAYVASITGESKDDVLAATPASVSPAPAPAARESAAPSTHVVRRGETLWRISQAYETTPAALRRANRLRSSTIRPGQRLTIPSGD